MNAFVERHQDKIAGVLSCFDRVVITGTLPDIGYAGAMAGYLSYHKIRLFDYPRWAEPLRNELRNHAERLAAEASLTIEFIRRHKAFRKEDRIKAIIAERDRRQPIGAPIAAVFSRRDSIVSWPACIDRVNPNVTHYEVDATHFSMGVDPSVWRVVLERLATT